MGALDKIHNAIATIGKHGAQMGVDVSEFGMHNADDLRRELLREYSDVRVDYRDGYAVHVVVRW